MLIISFSTCKKSENENENSSYFLRKKLTGIDEMGPSFIKKFTEDLYNSVRNGKIQAFRYDSLTPSCLLTKEQVADLGKTEEVVQIFPNPDFPDYYIDSLIVTRITLKDIKGFEVSVKMQRDKGKTVINAELNAFALRYIPNIGGIKLNEQALFWIKYKDLNQFMKKEDFKIMNDLVFKSILSTASDY